MLSAEITKAYQRTLLMFIAKLVNNIFFILIVGFIFTSFPQASFSKSSNLQASNAKTSKTTNLKSNSKLSKKLKAIIKKHGFKQSSLGIIISDSSFKEIYSLQADRLFTPASLMKIASLSAFYYYYPQDFRFQTQLLSSAPIQKTILQGDLFFKGGGDPSFTSEDLWNLVNVFSRSGIKKIQGNIVIDNSLYKKRIYMLPFFNQRSYTAPAIASSFNWNSVVFWIRPASQAGKPAQIYTDPENSFVKIVNRVQTTASNKKSNIVIKRIKQSSKGEVFRISGSIALHKKEMVKYSNIQNPSFYTGHNILNFLKQRGIELTGQVQLGSCSNCRALAQVQSKPLNFQTYNMMKYSNNLVARMLTTYLPILKGAPQADLNQGVELINDYLKNVAGLKGYKFVEPSGLNRKNKFSTRHFLKLLQKDSKHFYQPEMFSSYPLAGSSGTLKNRFKNRSKNKSQPVHIRAKTGFLSGISSLAGTAHYKNKTLNFVFMFNGSVKKSYIAKNLFDELILSAISE